LVVTVVMVPLKARNQYWCPLVLEENNVTAVAAAAAVESEPEHWM